MYENSVQITKIVQALLKSYTITTLAHELCATNSVTLTEFFFSLVHNHCVIFDPPYYKLEHLKSHLKIRG